MVALMPPIVLQLLGVVFQARARRRTNLRNSDPWAGPTPTGETNRNSTHSADAKSTPRAAAVSAGHQPAETGHGKKENS